MLREGDSRKNILLVLKLAESVSVIFCLVSLGSPSQLGYHQGQQQVHEEESEELQEFEA
jgi:hypothetical protein